ncbi:MAG TPA: hypothetical protein VI359_04210 [Nitrospiraceae bacterium]
MTGVETLAWLVLAFADGSDCLLQGTFQWLPGGRAFVREDGCAVQSHQEGGYVVFWSENRWVAIKIPTRAKSLSYRWGRAMAFVNGDSVKVQHGKIIGALQSGPLMSDHDNTTTLSKWRIGDVLVHRRVSHHQIM